MTQRIKDRPYALVPTPQLRLLSCALSAALQKWTEWATMDGTDLDVFWRDRVRQATEALQAVDDECERRQ